jgi:hypothetical protein
MNRGVDKLLERIDKDGLEGTDVELFERFADLRPSDLLAVISEKVAEGMALGEEPTEEGDLLFWAVERLAAVLAERAEPDAYRRAVALCDPEFTFSDPQPVA